MTNILENSLVMAVLVALILIPVFIIKRNNKKKKQVLIQSKIEKITSENNLTLTHTDSAMNFLIACSADHKLLFLSLIDFTYEIIELEKVINVKDDIDYNGKEVKSVQLVLTFNSGVNKNISFYKQYNDSEGELSAVKKLAAKWALLLKPAV
ncbi:MAG TPA: hypothetical protein VL125_12045 [Pelobium sp.]|nr:hypothetical protein [Pelobium sp.]